MTITPSLVILLSFNANKRCLQFSGSVELAMSKRRCMADATLLTFCPPEPCERMALNAISLSGIDKCLDIFSDMGHIGANLGLLTLTRATRATFVVSSVYPDNIHCSFSLCVSIDKQKIVTIIVSSSFGVQIAIQTPPLAWARLTGKASAAGMRPSSAQGWVYSVFPRQPSPRKRPQIVL